ncbi:MAG: hypothetical protein RLY18_90 [Pseudomonadota bacterium]|jgi:hypothetical protein
MKNLMKYLKSIVEAWSEARLAYIARNRKSYPMGS